jgi:hypothetical protein
MLLGMTSAIIWGHTNYMVISTPVYRPQPTMSLNGIGNRLGFELSLPETYVVTTFFSIALYNVL